MRVIYSTLLLVFGYCDETLSLMFDILLIAHLMHGCFILASAMCRASLRPFSRASLSAATKSLESCV